MSLDDKNNIVLSRLTTLNDALLKARTTRIEKDAVYSQVKSVSDLKAVESIPVVSQNPPIQTLKLRRADLQRQKVQSGRARYGDRNPEMVKVNTGLAHADSSTTSSRGSVPP